MKMADRPSII